MMADGRSFEELRPLVGGELGFRTELDTSVHPPRVHRLHYVLDRWPSDDLQQTFPCFVVVHALGERLLAAGFRETVTLAEVDVELSEQARRRQPDVVLPEFRWLQVHGRAGIDDLGITDRARLVVSASAKVILLSGEVPFCKVLPFHAE